MSTIFAMARQTTLMYQIANKGFSYGQAGGIPRFRDGLGKAPLSRHNDESGAALAPLYGNGASLRQRIKQQTAAKVEFNKKADTVIENLKKSTATLKSTDFTPTGTSAEVASGIKNAVSAVSDFVNKYNDTAKFFADHADNASRRSYSVDAFRSGQPLSPALASLGITTDVSTGQLKLDSQRLTESLQNTPKKAAALLGEKGLAKQGEELSQRAAKEQRQLTTTPNAGWGLPAVDTAKLMYSSQGLAKQSSYHHLGNLLHIFF